MRLTQRASTAGNRRVFRQFFWLKVGSGKVALSRPAHQRVTQAVGRFLAKQKVKEEFFTNE